MSFRGSRAAAIEVTPGKLCLPLSLLRKLSIHECNYERSEVLPRQPQVARDPLSHGVYPELVEGFARNDINRKHINLNESSAAKYKREQEKQDQMMDRISRKEAEDPFRGS
jgi:hypothetical protein